MQNFKILRPARQQAKATKKALTDFFKKSISAFAGNAFGWLSRPKATAYTFSIMIAEAPPPPLQMAAIPTAPDFCASTLLRVVTMRAPDAPSG